MPEEFYQRVYLAPHLDDAVLSCGGQIYQERQQGLTVLVVTVMAGDPPLGAEDGAFVAQLHARWELAGDHNPVAVRRAEDAAALSSLGADLLHWRWPDCIYRRHPETGAFLYAFEDALFGAVHPAESELVSVLSDRLARLPLASSAPVYVPLAVGGHVDHRLVRRAAEDCAALVGRRVYYEDYPYAEAPAALLKVLSDGACWRAKSTPLDEKALKAKSAAVACYRSQLGTFFTDEDEMALRLRRFAMSVSGGGAGAERYWYRERPAS